MKKTIIMALMAVASVSASAQQKQTIEIPSWLSNVKLSGYGMAQYQYSGQKDAESNSFNIRMARISLEGRIAGDFYWKTQIHLNGNTSTLGSSPRMVDLFAEWQKYEYFKVKIGQFKNPFTFENPIHPIEQGFMGYSQNVSKLAGFSDRAGEHASNGRDIGLQFQGDFLKNANGRNLLHYQIGAFNGQGINTKDVDNQKNVIGGIWVMPVSGMRIGAFGWTGSYARKGNWTETVADPTSSVTPGATKEITHTNEVRSLNQNRYAFSFEYKKDGWTVRSEYIHSTGKAFAKSITNFNDANAKDCSLNEEIGDKAQGVYGLVIAPLAQLPKNSRIDVKARYDMYQPNGKSNMQRTQYEAGLNFHIGKRISILTEYALINDKTLAKHNYSMADAEVCFRF
ncbi:porin [Segatella copri]|uniref:porin n=1 Tax=Segatella copri TaxID=165179 RepID=UPI001C45CD3C|nr:porin [Segatella copri]MBW0020433.1 OprO/OprP family phosphate-selective porin [Segatella copri]MBW0035777.1 OprO/OprP family phosphate-selective porin [Segatella copri]